MTDKEKINYLVSMHDLGLIRYELLTPINYYYWWYEVEKANATYGTIDKNKFTAGLRNFSITFKGLTFLKISKLKNKSTGWFLIFNESQDCVDNLEYRIKNWNDFIATKQPKQLRLF